MKFLPHEIYPHVSETLTLSAITTTGVFAVVFFQQSHYSIILPVVDFLVRWPAIGMAFAYAQD